VSLPVMLLYASVCARLLVYYVQQVLPSIPCVQSVSFVLHSLHEIP
jgi:hypothetical protein